MDMDIDQTEFAPDDQRSCFGLTLPDPNLPQHSTTCEVAESMKYFFDKLSVTWTIPNGILKLHQIHSNPDYSRFYTARQIGIVSPEFTEEDLPVSGSLWTWKPRWKIVLKPLHCRRSSLGGQVTEHISLLLDRVDTRTWASWNWNSNYNEINCTYRFDILNLQGESISSKSSSFRSIPEGFTVGWSAFESYAKLLEKDRLGSDLVIKCTIQRVTPRSYQLGRSQVAIPLPPPPPKSGAEEKHRYKIQITTALRTLKKQKPELRLAISKKKLKIVCHGQESLVNAEILAARSIWFCRYFETVPELFQQEPGIMPTLNKTDEDPKLFKAMLQFLCEGACGLLQSGTFQDKLDLFELAIKYENKDMSVDVVDSLVAAVELGNVVQLYFLFDQYALLEADSKPTVALRNFILKNRLAVSSLEHFRIDPVGCRLMFMRFVCWGFIRIPHAEDNLEQFINLN